MECPAMLRVSSTTPVSRSSKGPLALSWSLHDTCSGSGRWFPRLAFSPVVCPGVSVEQAGNVKPTEFGPGMRVLATPQ